MAAQGGVCAICAKACVTGQNLSVDHDHVTGANRGLLCRKCNMALGIFKDSKAKLARAMTYLERYD